MRRLCGMPVALTGVCAVFFAWAIASPVWAAVEGIGFLEYDDPVFDDPWSVEGPAILVDPGLEGADWTMKYANPSSPPTGWNSVTLLPHPVPEYHWWNGCSPTAAGMLFAYWDTWMDKSTLYTFHDGNSAYWDTVHMSMSSQNDYGRNGVYPSRATHSIVASWEHRQAGQAKGLNYGSWDRNGNGVVDASDRAAWNCLADFMRTEDGSTSRSRMAQGFEDFAAWDDPATPINESYDATARTDNTPSWNEYISEINAGFPVHVGISGHSILGCGYWDDPNGIYGTPGTKYVVNKTTWGGGSANKYGLIEFSEVYAFTTLRIGDAVVPPNRAPVAVGDTFNLNEDGPFIAYNYEGVLINDTDADGDALTAVQVTNTAHGTLTFYSTGALSYTPNANYHGADSFTYKANDGTNDSNAAVVTLNIASINDVPIVEDDAFSVAEGGTLLRYSYEGALKNDIDVDVEDTLVAELVSGTSHGSLEFYTSGGLKYIPESGFAGTDSFVYRAFDGQVYSDLATVLIEVVEAFRPIVGDATGDGRVDEADARIMAGNWGQTTTGLAAAGDFNEDGVVNAADAAILAANWGTQAETSRMVPEPAGVILLLGLVGCLALRRRGR